MNITSRIKHCIFFLKGTSGTSNCLEFHFQFLQTFNSIFRTKLLSCCFWQGKFSTKRYIQPTDVSFSLLTHLNSHETNLTFPVVVITQRCQIQPRHFWHKAVFLIISILISLQLVFRNAWVFLNLHTWRLLYSHRNEGGKKKKISRWRVRNKTLQSQQQ